MSFLFSISDLIFLLGVLALVLVWAAIKVAEWLDEG